MTKDERNKKILEMRLSGMSFTKIGNAFGISKQAVSEIINRRNRRLSYGVRGQGFLIDEIVYQGIYDYFCKNEYESITSFCKKVFGHASSIERFKYFIRGKWDSHFSLQAIKKMCEVIGEPFEVVFAIRKNMED